MSAASWASGISRTVDLDNIRGRSLASSSSSASMVLRLMHEHRSRDAKNAEATLAPTQLATRSSFSQDMKLQLLLLSSSITFDIPLVFGCTSRLLLFRRFYF
uniref:Uncharacterized protein n=1 Tax=Rhizophora mucronata TaxID=61149 RepID=A0A2P2JER3_RHIMU